MLKPLGFELVLPCSFAVPALSGKCGGSLGDRDRAAIGFSGVAVALHVIAHGF